jgi:hypothetical protein
VPNGNKGDEKKGCLLNQIIPPIVIAILVGGTSPWWYKEFFIREPISEPTSSSPSVVSRDFFVGQWQVQQAIGQFSGGTVIDYLSDGRFEGEGTEFIGGVGSKVRLTGYWQFSKLSEQEFILMIWFDNGSKWQGKFRIIDQDHIHNIDQNYVAVRLK